MPLFLMSSNNISNYLSKVHNVFKDKNQSLTDILNNFRQISKEYNDFDSKTNNIIFNYSSYNFLECTKEEQDIFINEQLQFIECLVINSIYEKTGITWNWYDIFNLLISPEYKLTDKISRKVVYPTSYNKRPIGDPSFLMWNGLQIIDLDIKDYNLADALKPILFDNLKKYNWFLGICKSASQKSLHIWTKITPISFEQNNRKIEYLCNFRHKYSYIYIILLKYMNKFSYTKENIIEYIDMAMAKPQQGIFISSDDKALLNTNFIDTRLDVNFEPAFNSGIESINWISHPDLKNIFSKLEWFNKENTDEVEISNVDNINIRDIKKSKGKVHYKHAQRWQLANTLTSLYGYDKALQIMSEICSATPYKELKGDVKTASIHNKPISIWAINELNKQHGFNLQITQNINVDQGLIDKFNDAKDDDDPIQIINDNNNRIIFNIKNTQYLSDIKDNIINNLDHITLLEAGAGYGKTEMIKSLHAKTLLILPFTSTIKAKIEADEKTSDWLYYYGNKRPTLDELFSDKSVSMTIDKFSRLNLMELNQADFKYIVIDESHLLFTSSYRDVMSPAIQRLANCNSKVIMMTGTPTGELLFFPSIKHIRVIKEDNRIKKFDIYFTPSKYEKIYEMCKAIANDIANGKKILFPTNNGTLYFEQISGLIQQILIEMGSEINIKTFYYKKSNYGDDSMDMINIQKSIGNNDIIFCSNYLSVGVDICDRYSFSVYFSDLYIAQDIEQFANRLRNNDLYINLFLEKEDANGFKINYDIVKKLDLSISQEDILIIRDLIQTCNDMIERNQEESKYNPLVQSLLATNRYLKYDENDCKYYIDETTYKLKVFEERYSDYSKQLQVLAKNMKYYGYDISVHNSNDRISERKKEFLDDFMRTCRHTRIDYWTTQTFKFLSHITENNIDIYKDLMKGDYAIFKDSEYKEERLENNLYVENIEVLEKNIPLVINLYKYYDCETIINIFKHCVETRSNRINYAKLNRIIRFITIESNRRKKRIDFPIYKFIKDTYNFAKNNKFITNENILKYLSNYAVKYANYVKDLVIEDTHILEMIYEVLKDLWKIIIIQTKAKNGTYHIKPFELLWERKDNLLNIYGTDLTKEFFADLLDNMKPEDDENIDLPELIMTPKKTINDINNDLNNIIYTPYDYYKYSDLDNSNDKFIEKQKSQMSNMNNTDNINNEINDSIKDLNEMLGLTLFDNTHFE